MAASRITGLGAGPLDLHFYVAHPDERGVRHDRVAANLRSGLARRRIPDPGGRDWPRGFSKEKAAVNLWLKEIAPSTVLRKWFAHDPAKWKEFVRRYHRELDGRAEAVASVQELARQGDRKSVV